MEDSLDEVNTFPTDSIEYHNKTTSNRTNNKKSVLSFFQRISMMK